MYGPQQSNPRYGPQQDSLHDGALSIHSQVDHQQQSVLRHGEGGGRRSLVHNQQEISSRGELLGQHGPRPSTAQAGDLGHRQHYRIQHHFQQQQQSRRGLAIGGPFIGEDRRDGMPGVTSHHHQKQQVEQRRHRHQKDEDESLAAMYLQQSAETLAAGDPFLSQRGSSTSTGRGRPGSVAGALRHDHYDQQLEQHQQRRGLGTAWDDTLVDLLHNKVGLRNEDPLLEDASRQRGVEVGYRGQGETGRVFGRSEKGDGNEPSPGLLYKPLDQQEDYQQRQRLNRQSPHLQHGGNNRSRVDQGLGGLLNDLRDDSGYFS